MFDLYTHATLNGYKITIALEELDLTYEVYIAHNASQLPPCKVT